MQISAYDNLKSSGSTWLDLWPEIMGTTEMRTTNYRHSRESGNPEISAAYLDSRLRGNDEGDREVG
jgi:hypothetical protein